MNWKLTLDIAQIVVSILLMGVILLQSRSSGLGAAFGGSDTIITTRRGPEKAIFTLTIILSILFMGIAFLRMFVV